MKLHWIIIATREAKKKTIIKGDIFQKKKEYFFLESFSFLFVFAAKIRTQNKFNLYDQTYLRFAQEIIQIRFEFEKHFSNTDFRELNEMPVYFLEILFCI